MAWPGGRFSQSTRRTGAGVAVAAGGGGAVAVEGAVGVGGTWTTGDGEGVIGVHATKNRRTGINQKVKWTLIAFQR